MDNADRNNRNEYLIYLRDLNINRCFIDAMRKFALTSYILKSKAGVHNNIAKALKEGNEDIRLTKSDVLKLAHFFEFDVEEFLLSWTLQEKQKNAVKLLNYTTYKDYVKLQISHDCCIHCTTAFTSYIFIYELKFADKFNVICPKCGQMTDALTNLVEKPDPLLQKDAVEAFKA